MLEAAIYHLLKKHFRPEPYYVDLLELFLEVSAHLTLPGSTCRKTPFRLLSARQFSLGLLRIRGIASRERTDRWRRTWTRARTWTRRHIAHTPQTTFQTELGQLIDLITAPEDHVDLSKFSLEK
jgi:hypothetical protein